MNPFLQRLIAALQRRSLPAQTAVISAAIILVALIADYIVNVVLMPGVTPYTPVGTLVIALAVAPPFTFFALRLAAIARIANDRLAAEQSARAALEAAHEARSRFLANTSHELRTPLNGIIGYSELMLETAEAEGRENDANDHRRVVALSHRLLHLLNGLLDLAKVEAKRISLNIDRYDVRELLVEAVESVRGQADANGNRLELCIAEDLSDGRADAHRLGQCVQNLLSNAAKFTRNGVVSVSATRRREAGMDWLSIDVRDTGDGIAPERQVVLFEPFMAPDSSIERHGVGLGLVITQRLARLMGGDVSVASTPGQGSCFTLRAPLFAPEPASSEDDSALRVQSAA